MGKITWDKVKKHLNGSFKTEMGSDDMVKITFVYTDDNDRTQLVLVDHEQQEKRLVVEVVSRVGQIPANRLPEALEYIGKKYFVGLEKMGDNYYVRVSVDMNYTPLDAINSIIRLVGNVADTLEKDLVTGDAN